MYTFINYKDSLLRIPGVTKDRMGNFHFVGEVEQEGLRQRFDFIMGMDAKNLAGVHLAALLNWLRWGSEMCVMWEFTLPEMIELVERWETANTERELYLVSGGHDFSEDWLVFWQKRGELESVHQRYRCECGQVHLNNYLCSTIDPNGDCQKCGRYRSEFQAFTDGPRGEGTYNLVSVQADGVGVAYAAYLSRGVERDLPTKFKELAA